MSARHLFSALLIVHVMALGAFAKSISPLKSCAECVELANIEKKAKLQMLKPSVDFAPLCLQAAKVIVDMSKKTPQFDEARIESMVSIFKVLVPKDPGHSLLNLTAPVILANREAIDAKLATLTKEESTYLTAAIDDAMKDPPKGVDETTTTTGSPTPVPAGLPGK